LPRDEEAEGDFFGWTIRIEEDLERWERRNGRGGLKDKNDVMHDDDDCGFFAAAAMHCTDTRPLRGEEDIVIITFGAFLQVLRLLDGSILACLQHCWAGWLPNGDGSPEYF